MCPHSAGLCVTLASACASSPTRLPLAAAGQWGHVVGGRPPFEEIALKLVEAGDPDALAVFLKTKLQVLGRNDKAQSTLVASWLAELLLDAANRSALEAGGDSGEPRHKAAVDALRSFLSEYVDVLDVGTTTGLLASYGAGPSPGGDCYACTAAVRMCLCHRDASLRLPRTHPTSRPPGGAAALCGRTRR